MGLTTQLHKQTSFFDKETTSYLMSKTNLLVVLNSLIKELKLNEDEVEKKIQVEVHNNDGEVVLLTLVGVNSTSLVSSEMKGSITFTFIKDIDEIIKVVKTRNKANGFGLRLVKTNME